MTSFIPTLQPDRNTPGWKRSVTGRAPAQRGLEPENMTVTPISARANSPSSSNGLTGPLARVLPSNPQMSNFQGAWPGMPGLPPALSPDQQKTLDTLNAQWKRMQEGRGVGIGFMPGFPSKMANASFSAQSPLPQQLGLPMNQTGLPAIPQRLDSQFAMGGNSMNRLVKAQQQREAQQLLAPLAQSGAPMVRINPGRTASDLTSQNIPLTNANGGVYVDPAHVPAGVQFQTGGHPQVNWKVDPNNPLTVESTGRGTVALLPPPGWTPNWSNLTMEQRKQIRADKDAARAERQQAARSADTWQNRRRNRQLAHLDPLSRMTPEQYRNAPLIPSNYQAGQNLNKLLNAEVNAAVQQAVPNGVNSTADARTKAQATAKVLVQQARSGQRSWEEVLKAAQEADQTSLKDGTGIGNANIADLVRQEQNRYEQASQLNRGMIDRPWEFPLPTMR